MLDITLRQVSHSFRSTVVLRKVDLHLPPGSTMALMGPSGSGKSTLLSILGGLIPPSDGTLTIRGPSDLAEARTEFGWVLQTTSALGTRTVWDNVKLGAMRLRLRPSRERALVADAIGKCGLAGLERRRARTLSGGELQRVSIARALAGRPLCMLADEPTGQLDRSTTSQVLDAMFTSGRDCSVVLATHDPDVAARCDRIVHLVNGRIREGASIGS